MAYLMEYLVFIASLIITVVYLVVWYSALSKAWPPERYDLEKKVFGTLPALALVIIVFSLRFLASFDVVGDFFYMFFYVVLGYVWVLLCLAFMFLFFGFSWKDDALNANNHAALYAIAGGYIGSIIIYAGANIGDGPGWWCVLFAGGMGLICWGVIATLVNLFTGIFERITVDRDTSAGIRFGGFLLASGIVLGRASAGDWTSFWATVVEFRDGWPVVVLAIAAIIIEKIYARKPKLREDDGMGSSTIIAILYVIIAIACVVLLPSLNENPAYPAAFVQVAKWVTVC